MFLSNKVPLLNAILFPPPSITLSLSEFHTLVKDIEATLTDTLDYEEDMADMYLTHYAKTRQEMCLY